MTPKAEVSTTTLRQSHDAIDILLVRLAKELDQLPALKKAMQEALAELATVIRTSKSS